jgi:magnesium chelatase family protein
MIMPGTPENAARLISELKIIEISSLVEAVQYVASGVEPDSVTERPQVSPVALPDIAEVKGQKIAKRALLIAAAGGHNVLFVGPPGCGKSMLASRFPGLFPFLNRSEMLEVARVHSIAGTSLRSILCGVPPFRSPHHVISEAGLVGGGAVPRPGEVSLAHRGVLFLDEFPEFRRSAIEALRAPIEVGSVTVSRARGTVNFPAKFQLIAAMNPCPCGRLGAAGMQCTCSRTAIAGYLKKLSQPILDRIDLQVHMESVTVEEIVSEREARGEGSADLRKQVLEVRRRSSERLGKCNARLDNQEVSHCVKLTDSAQQLIERVTRKGVLSARKYFRILKVSRTIADLDGVEQVGEEHLAEALSYRCLEKIEAFAGLR